MTYGVIVYCQYCQKLGRNVSILQRAGSHVIILGKNHDAYTVIDPWAVSVDCRHCGKMNLIEFDRP